MGDKTLANVQLYVCDISKSCSPALGILGLDLFPALGIEIHGVPVNYPRSPNHDDDFIEKEDPDFDVEWLEKYKAQPELREQLVDLCDVFFTGYDGALGRQPFLFVLQTDLRELSLLDLFNLRSHQ